MERFSGCKSASLTREDLRRTMTLEIGKGLGLGLIDLFLSIKYMQFKSNTVSGKMKLAFM